MVDFDEGPDVFQVWKDQYMYVSKAYDIMQMFIFSSSTLHQIWTQVYIKVIRIHKKTFLYLM